MKKRLSVYSDEKPVICATVSSGISLPVDQFPHRAPGLLPGEPVEVPDAEVQIFRNLLRSDIGLDVLADEHPAFVDAAVGFEHLHLQALLLPRRQTQPRELKQQQFAQRLNRLLGQRKRVVGVFHHQRNQLPQMLPAAPDADVPEFLQRAVHIRAFAFDRASQHDLLRPLLHALGGVQNLRRHHQEFPLPQGQLLSLHGEIDLPADDIMEFVNRVPEVRGKHILKIAVNHPAPAGFHIHHGVADARGVTAEVAGRNQMLLRVIGIQGSVLRLILIPS